MKAHYLPGDSRSMESPKEVDMVKQVFIEM